MSDYNLGQAPFPEVVGNELETSVVIGRKFEVPDPEIDLEGFTITKTTTESPEDVRSFVPRDIGMHGAGFTDNGFRVYLTAGKIEVATPECATVDELVLSMRAGEHMLTLGAAERFYAASADNRPSSIRIHKRVADSETGAWGCHDNYSYTNFGADELLSYFLLSRSLLTGAGRVEESGGYRFAQKIDRTLHVSYYGFAGRLYRHDTEHGPRLEIGSGDANISDWAARIRIGGVVLLKALEKFGITRELKDIAQGRIGKAADAGSKERTLAYGRQINGVEINGDGINLSAEQKIALAFQRKVAELTLTSLVEKTEVPSELLSIARDSHEFCDDLEAVDRGDKPYTDLADRADWAAKLEEINRRIKRDIEQKKIKRNFGDFESRRDDLLYDCTILNPKGEEGCSITLGFGLTRRARGKFRRTPAQKTVEKAFKEPPATRAKARSAILRSGIKVHSATWQKINIGHGCQNIEINLSDPASAEVPEPAKEMIHEHTKEQIRLQSAATTDSPGTGPSA